MNRFSVHTRNYENCNSYKRWNLLIRCDFHGKCTLPVILMPFSQLLDISPGYWIQVIWARELQAYVLLPGNTGRQWDKMACMHKAAWLPIWSYPSQRWERCHSLIIIADRLRMGLLISNMFNDLFFKVCCFSTWNSKRRDGYSKPCRLIALHSY
jgi:hypothetical protein